MQLTTNPVARIVALFLVALAVASPAHAVVDITAALAGVTDAQTALLALLAAFIGLSAALFGVVKVYGFLKRKTGA